MPSLIDIRRRVRSVKSTQQVTKAMKMIAAARLRRAQDRVIQARPFAREMRRVLASVASRVETSAHPLLAQPEVGAAGPALLIVITADRGSCGGFNNNVIKAVTTWQAEHPGRKVVLSLVGRKGRDFFRRRNYDVKDERIGIFSQLKVSDAQAIAAIAIDEFTSGRVSDVYVLFNEFKSVMTQRVTIEQMLPIPRLEDAASQAAAGGAQVDYLYEPDPQQILNDLLPRHLEMQVYRALLESSAAEHAARMTAMDTATRNASEMIESLTLYMNKVRQAAITREIIEVVSGAQAL